MNHIGNSVKIKVQETYMQKDDTKNGKDPRLNGLDPFYFYNMYCHRKNVYR